MRTMKRKKEDPIRSHVCPVITNGRRGLIQIGIQGLMFKRESTAATEITMTRRGMNPLTIVA
ncbi:MAG: hypothetical protein QXW47_01915 [Candidatus Jordarchaeales archaeon]